MLLTLISILGTLLVCQVQAARPSPGLFGNCYDIKTPTDFDFKTFSTGKWFEVAKYDNEFESGADCIEQTFFLKEDTTSIAISYSMRLKNGSQAMVQAAVNYTLTEEEALLDVSFPDEPTPAEFDVLATDFKNYAITYSCRQTTPEGSPLPTKDERLWVLSRTPQLSDEAEEAVEDNLIYNGDSLSTYLYPTNQDNCV